MFRLPTLAALPLTAAFAAAGFAAETAGDGAVKTRRGGLRRLAERQTGRPAPDQAGGPAGALRRRNRPRTARTRRRCRRAAQAARAGRLHGRAGRRGHHQPARHARRAERRSLRRRQQGQQDPRLPHRRRQRQAGRGQRLRERAAPALRHRLLSARAEPAMGLRRQQRQRRALSLQERRPEGDGQAGADRRAHPGDAPLDARHRRFSPTARRCSSRSVRAPTSRSTWARSRSADWTSS